MMRGLFITGTDTGVGKTHVACESLVKLRGADLRVGAYKPVCSGSVFDSKSEYVWDDVDSLRSALGREVPVDSICPQRFVAPLAPPMAARAQGRSVDRERIRLGFESWRSECDVLIVEGAGGLLCPLTESDTMAEFAAEIGFPLVIVARPGLGTINHTLLTIEVARQRRLNVAGVILNETTSANDDSLTFQNAEEIERRGRVLMLGIRRFKTAAWVSRVGLPIELDWSSLVGIH